MKSAYVATNVECKDFDKTRDASHFFWLNWRRSRGRNGTENKSKGELQEKMAKIVDTLNTTCNEINIDFSDRLLEKICHTCVCLCIGRLYFLQFVLCLRTFHWLCICC